MITPDEALDRLLELASPVTVETVPLLEAAGRWSAEPVSALRTQPSRDLSGMDGYAIRHCDLPGPWQVTGEAAAGNSFAGTLDAGEAARISTGAALPPGADTIIIQEDVDREEAAITLTGDMPEHGQHVRARGCDFVAEQIIIERGARLTPARIALAASAGHAALLVRRRVRVAIVATGDELIAIGEDGPDDRLPASNSVMLATMLANLPVEIIDCGIVGDDREALSTAFAEAAAGCDILVTTGGASVGDHDLVRPALIDAGGEIDFWKIAMRPGKPLLAGRLGEAVMLGLPGNPVSAFVTAMLFLKPLIAHMSGARDPSIKRMRVRLGCDLAAGGERAEYIRACWVGGAVCALDRDSGMLVPLAAAEALIVRPAHAPAGKIGDEIEIITLA